MNARRATLIGDASGAVADLGVLIPILAALVASSGLHAPTALVGVGALYLASGLYFGVPVPVQPIKAAAAIVIARKLPASHLSAAGIDLGIVLLALSVTGGARALSRIFTKPIVRGLQLGVGLLLLRVAWRAVSGDRTALIVAVLIAVSLLVSGARSTRFPLALIVVAGGVVWSLAHGAHLAHAYAGVWHPHIGRGALRAATLWSAFVVLVIPQIPLTFGNAVVALSDLEHDYFGERARRATPSAVALSCGAANVLAGALGGMPMCHGSGGLTAHYRAGARTRRMNVMIGAIFLTLGLAFGPIALSVLALIPATVLAGMLAFTGAAHAWLASDLRGVDMLIAVAMGALGWATSNLAWSLALGIALVWAPRVIRRSIRTG